MNKHVANAIARELSRGSRGHVVEVVPNRSAGQGWIVTFTNQETGEQVVYDTPQRFEEDLRRIRLELQEHQARTQGVR